MGPLSLPAQGPIYFDASSLIYSVERVDPYITLLDPVWQQAEAGRFIIVSSELTIAETLAKPIRDGDARLEALFRALFQSRDFDLIPATRELWEVTARVRAETDSRRLTHFTPQLPCMPNVRLSSPTMLIFAAWQACRF